MGYISDRIPQILEHIKIVNKNQSVYEARLLELFEGSITKYLEEALDSEFSPQASARTKERLVSINILPKIIKKVSACYAYGITRDTDDENLVDKENVTFYENDLALDSVMNLANKFINLFRYCSIEPYLSKDGTPSLRVLPPTSFTVFSDDEVNPLEPTVFIKFIGTQKKEVRQRTDQYGNSQIDTDRVIEEVDIFHMYSDEEFLCIDSDGDIRTDLMENNQEGINYFGRIPFIYLNTSKNLLLPLPNADLANMALFVPRLLSDLCYASKFQSHSILYSIDLETENLVGNPDSFWNLKSSDKEGSSPTIGSIKPTVDVDKILNLIQSTLTIWFDSLGIKASAGVGNLTAEGAASGIAKAIDQGDTTEIRTEQLPLMRKAELDLWALLKVQHEFWAQESVLVKPFSSGFDIAVEFGEPEIFVDKKTTIESSKMKYEAGLTSFRRAVMEANAHLNSEEIDELILEIEAEKAVKAEKAATLFNSPEPETDEEEVEEVEE